MQSLELRTESHRQTTLLFDSIWPTSADMSCALQCYTVCVPVMQPHADLELQQQDSASGRCLILSTTRVYSSASWPIALKSSVQLQTT